MTLSHLEVLAPQTTRVEQAKGLTSMMTGKGMTTMTYSVAIIQIQRPTRVTRARQRVKVVMVWMRKIGDSLKSFPKDSMQRMRINLWKGTN